MTTETKTRELVLGTAGHIDHGKTALVRALTGVDCDRLPQEKKRGITIDLGFAELDLGNFRLGVVDVPGHERFVKNMLAGASGIDIAMLVVAADDSVMPQTKEHLAILELLGIERGLIALTKTDIADPDWVEMVEDDVRQLVKGSFLEGAPIIKTSAHTGDGVDDLRTAICGVCEDVATEPSDALFRLPIDRVMTFPGIGTVITGTVWQGKVPVGDQVERLPSGEQTRIRSAQSHGKDAASVNRGQRAALNLAGVHHTEVERGQELASPGYLKPSKIITVRLNVLETSPWPIKHRARVRLHLGTQESIAAIHLLEGTAIAPGESAYAQLYVAQPIVATCMQPFVLRTESPVVTVGGGRVIQPCAERIARRDTDVLQQLPAHHSKDADTRCSAAARAFGRSQWDALALCRDADVTPSVAEAQIERLEKEGQVLRMPISAQREGLFHSEVVAWMHDRVMAALSKMHEQSPLAAAFPIDQLYSRIAYLGETPLLQHLIKALVKKRLIVGGQRMVSHGERAPKLTASQRKIKAQVIDAIVAGGMTPPTGKELAKTLGLSEANLKPIMELCTIEGNLYHMDQGLYLGHEAEQALRDAITKVPNIRQGVTVGEIREALGTSRKFALPCCVPGPRRCNTEERRYTQARRKSRRYQGGRCPDWRCAMTENVKAPGTDKATAMRSIPPVDGLIAHAALDAWREKLPDSLIAGAARAVIDAYRASLLSQGDTFTLCSADELAAEVGDYLQADSAPPLTSVVNATGILIHTGLGRSPLAATAVEAMADAAAYFAPVELEMATGQRGQRNDITRKLLQDLTGAESAVVVNNNAAALLLILTVVAQGGSVVLSRGEMVEIGGSFRVPDVMRAAGCDLAEVGTTNKTRLSDYENAIDETTKGLLKVHPSNYRIEGFTEAVSIESLAPLGKKHGLPVIDDVGSGALFDYGPWGLRDEPVVRHSVAAGADIVCFSGDKLLGGPQAGIIVGKKEWIDRIEKHPMMRALRVDKITLAALGSTLQLHRDPAMAAKHIPILRMLTTPMEVLRKRGEAMRDKLASAGHFESLELVETEAYMGGGSNPAQAVPSLALRMKPKNLAVGELARKLRTGTPAILPRIADDAIWLDLRTIFPAQDDRVASAVAEAINTQS